MTDIAGPEEIDKSKGSRRAVLVAGGVAAVGTVAAVAAAAAPAEAANGSAVILGANNSSSTQTLISSTAHTGAALTGKTTGAAAGALFTSTLGNGFAGGTYSANQYGVSAANYSSAAGGGAAIAASGGANTGLNANTHSALRSAVYAANYGAHGDSASAVQAAGGQNFGLVASTGTALSFGILAFNTATSGTFTAGNVGAIAADGGSGDGLNVATEGDPQFFSAVSAFHTAGGAAVYGNGGIGVQGYSNDAAGSALWAQADGASVTGTLPVGLTIETIGGATDAIVATGAVTITGDLFVDGTIHTNHLVDTAWVPPAVRQVQRRAIRSAKRVRASLPRP